MPKKKSNKPYLIAIAIIALLAVIVAAVYISQMPAPKRDVGVKAGDEFTYKMTGTADVPTEDTVVPENFFDINKVEYYRVKITNVEYPMVSYTETTKFINGTSFDIDDKINVESGATMSGGFWGVFIANLTIGSLARPEITDGVTIESTEIRNYRDGERQTNFLRAEAVFYDVDDPTLSRTYEAYTYVYFDSQLGVLVELTDIKMYSDPQVILTVKMELISSNVLQVP
jgi:hypothetical protein